VCVLFSNLCIRNKKSYQYLLKLKGACILFQNMIAKLLFFNRKKKTVLRCALDKSTLSVSWVWKILYIDEKDNLNGVERCNVIIYVEDIIQRKILS
jgi:hypothetical protein